LRITGSYVKLNLVSLCHTTHLTGQDGALYVALVLEVVHLSQGSGVLDDISGSNFSVGSGLTGGLVTGDLTLSFSYVSRALTGLFSSFL
jgi:hypothetical protein